MTWEIWKCTVWEGTVLLKTVKNDFKKWIMVSKMK